MLKVSRILTALTLYHGRNLSRPYTGKYIFLTPDPGYASQYSDGKTIQTYELIVPPAQIFSLKNAGDLAKLSEAVNNPQVMKSIMNASTTGELDWSAYGNIHNDQFEEAEDLFRSLGYKGVWLGERAGITSILIFDQKDVRLTGNQPAKYKMLPTGSLP